MVCRRDKRCPRCTETLPAEQFPPNVARPDGLGSYCRRCQRLHSVESYDRHAPRIRPIHVEANTRRRQENRARVLEYLSWHPCVDCGERDPVVLEFDHRDGEEKEAEIARLVHDGAAWYRVQREIDKCDVRCANDHRRRHYRERLAHSDDDDQRSQARRDPTDCLTESTRAADDTGRSAPGNLEIPA
jgi:hypothetical protein